MKQIYVCAVCGASFHRTPRTGRNTQYCGRTCAAAGLRVEVAARFWEKVSKSENGCWLWTGSTTSNGYGQISVGRKPRKAHRVAYELAHGAITNGTFVCHKCDTPLCVRPDHLFLGTHADNMADMTSKKRYSNRAYAGEENTQSKLTVGIVREIRAVIAGGHISQSELARQMNLSPTTISAIVLRKRWKHVD